MDYDAVLFDNDGVLVEGTAGAVMRRGVENAFRSAGVEEPDPEHVSTLTQFSAVTVGRVCEIAHEYDLAPEAFWTRREEEVHAVQREAMRRGEKALYGDFGAAAQLAEDGLPLGIASNNQQATVEYMVEEFDLDGLFGALYGVEPDFDGLRRKKPDPYYLARAAADLGVGGGGSDVLYVGDKETDVRAARWAGFDAVYLRRDDDQVPAAALDPTPEFAIESLEELPAVVAGRRPTAARE